MEAAAMIIYMSFRWLSVHGTFFKVVARERQNTAVALDFDHLSTYIGD